MSPRAPPSHEALRSLAASTSGIRPRADRCPKMRMRRAARRLREADIDMPLPPRFHRRRKRFPRGEWVHRLAELSILGDHQGKRSSGRRKPIGESPGTRYIRSPRNRQTCAFPAWRFLRRVRIMRFRSGLSGSA